MAFDVRAMENIATAPATLAERIVATWAAAGFLIFVAVTVPFARLSLPPVAAFVPAVTGTAVLALGLTSILFYVQYRIARSWQLALMAIAYGSSSFLSACYVLTFPNVFSPDGLFGAGPQTAAWIGTFDQLLFGIYLIAFALADRFRLLLSRGAIRIVAAGNALFVLALVGAAIALPLPALIDGTRNTGLTNGAITPLELGVMALAAAAIVSSGLKTVTQVWLTVVTLVYIAQIVTTSAIAGGRYTAGWYAGRLDGVLAAAVLLAVFLVKINDLLLRLASRNRVLAERTELAELEIEQGEERYRSLANVVPQLIWTADAAGTVDYVNDRWIAYTGLDLAETRQNGWRAAIDPSLPTSLRDAWHESLRSGNPLRNEYRLFEGRTGRVRWFLINAIPMRASDGRIVRWIASCTDIDQSKRIEERELFLARAGDRLSASIDLDATLETIAALVVDRMAAWARVDLFDEDGHLHTAMVAGAPGEERRALGALLGREVDDALEGPFAQAFAKRDAVVVNDAAAFAGGARGVRAGRAVVVPLTSGDTSIGALTLVRPEASYPDAEDLAVARDFGRRASQALGHARLYERERTTADALQRAMLPATLPEYHNVSFSASYSAASESQRVGGDFYDAFPLSDGRVALTIGDVTGHGIEAAVIMGEIRQGLRAASFESAQPSVILDRVSRLLVASGRSVFVTAVFGVLDVDTGVFRYATAGHPSPLVYDGQRLIRLMSSGLPIGLRDAEGVDFAITLPPRCTLVLFTDGLLEFTRDLDDGERRIEAAVRALGGGKGPDLAAALRQRVLGSDVANDDIAILTASVHTLPRRAGGELREWRFASSDGRTAAAVRREIGVLVDAWTGRANASHESELAFGELFANVVRHAPGPLNVTARTTPDGAEITVSDRGGGFDGQARPSEMYAESGRGLHLVRAVADAMSVARNAGGGTTVRVGFSRAPAVVPG